MMWRARVFAGVLRLALGITGAGALWTLAHDGGRTDSPLETLVSGALVLVMIAVTQEACGALIHDASVGRCVAPVAFELLVIAGLQAGAALLTDSHGLAVSVFSWALALVFLALSGRLMDPEYRRVLRALQAARKAQSERAAVAARTRESGRVS